MSKNIIGLCLPRFLIITNKLYIQGVAKSILFFAVFSAIARNLKVKFYRHI